MNTTVSPTQLEPDPPAHFRFFTETTDRGTLWLTWLGEEAQWYECSENPIHPLGLAQHANGAPPDQLLNDPDNHTLTEVAFNDLPLLVQKAVRTNFPHYKPIHYEILAALSTTQPLTEHEIASATGIPAPGAALRYLLTFSAAIVHRPNSEANGEEATYLLGPNAPAHIYEQLDAHT